jgi:hypothetical protein
MPCRPAPSLVSLVVALMLLPPAGGGQTIQRCEGAGGRVSYSNAECPPGTRPVRAVAPAKQPSPEEQNEARERAQREREVAQSLATRRQPPAASGASNYVTAEDARRAADCAYLRAEFESNQRLREMLTMRPYYSTEDVEAMDARNARLAADYRRFCSR